MPGTSCRQMRRNRPDVGSRLSANVLGGLAGGGMGYVFTMGKQHNIRLWLKRRYYTPFCPRPGWYGAAMCWGCTCTACLNPAVLLLFELTPPAGTCPMAADYIEQHFEPGAGRSDGLSSLKAVSGFTIFSLIDRPSHFRQGVNVPVCLCAGRGEQFRTLGASCMTVFNASRRAKTARYRQGYPWQCALAG
jgi:hypothetical protein